MLDEANASDGVCELSGPSLLHPSGIMGQGVCGGGDMAKKIIFVTVGKPTFPQLFYHIG